MHRNQEENNGYWGLGIEGNGVLLFSVHRISLGWWKLMEMSSGNGYTTLWMYSMPLNCTLRLCFKKCFALYFITIKIIYAHAYIYMSVCMNFSKT